MHASSLALDSDAQRANSRVARRRSSSPCPTLLHAHLQRKHAPHPKTAPDRPRPKAHAAHPRIIDAPPAHRTSTNRSPTADRHCHRLHQTSPDKMQRSRSAQPVSDPRLAHRASAEARPVAASVCTVQAPDLAALPTNRVHTSMGAVPCCQPGRLGWCRPTGFAKAEVRGSSRNELHKWCLGPRWLQFLPPPPVRSSRSMTTAGPDASLANPMHKVPPSA